MGKTTYISVPCGLTRTREIIDLAERIKAYGKDVQLHAYDTVQGLQWNGGRVIMNTQMSDTPFVNLEQLYDVTVDNLPEAVRRVKMLNDHGIPFNLTINNVLENVDVEDYEGNYLLRAIENDMNWVTVATRALTHHVKANYPKLKMTCSICFAWGRIEEYIKACQFYDLVVMMPFFAYMPEELAKLPAEKVSFILNDWCDLFCYRKDHYQAMGRCSLGGHHTKEEQERNSLISNCNFRTVRGYNKKLPEGIDQATRDRITKLAEQQIFNSGDPRLLPGGEPFNISKPARLGLLKLGVNHFKLQGREMVRDHFARRVVHFLDTFVREEL